RDLEHRLDQIRLTGSGRCTVKLLVWLLLFVLCWPVALLALLLYPIVWLFLLPFRLVGIAVDGLFEFLRALFLLPARVLGSRR
ncbi:MAG: hypothetical protein ACM3NQ_16075, partial [Bacteroidales bacterium]